MKVKFTLIENQTTDQDFYEFWVNGMPFATIGDDVITWHVFGKSLSMTERMRFLAIVWGEFECRESWSDFECVIS